MKKVTPVSQLNNKGVAIALFAVCLAILTIVGVVAVDLSYLYATKGQLQNAADSAAMAGAGAISTILGRTDLTNPADIEFAAKKVAKLFAEENWAGDNSITLDPEDMKTGVWDFNTRTFTEGLSPPNAIKVTARQNVNKLFFAQLFGVSGIPVASEAYAALGGRNIMLVLDASRSMNKTAQSGKKLIVELCGAAETFLDSLQINLVDDRVGIYFYHTFLVGPPGQSELKNLSQDENAKDELLSALSSGSFVNWSPGVGGYPKDGWTCIACGMQAAKNEFASSRPSENGVKIMIVMTDGYPNVTLAAAQTPSTVGKYAYEHSPAHHNDDLTRNTEVKEEILKIAEELADESVIIYTIGLGKVDDDLLSEMANITGGQYYHTTSAENLDSIFMSIATEIPIILAK